MIPKTTTPPARRGVVCAAAADTHEGCRLQVPGDGDRFCECGHRRMRRHTGKQAHVALSERVPDASDNVRATQNRGATDDHGRPGAEAIERVAEARDGVGVADDLLCHAVVTEL